MCGILGIISNEVVTQKSFSKLEYLLTLSETRGKEASGLCVLSSENFDRANIIKSNLSPSELIKQKNSLVFPAIYDTKILLDSESNQEYLLIVRIY